MSSPVGPFHLRIVPYYCYIRKELENDFFLLTLFERVFAKIRFVVLKTVPLSSRSK